MKKYENFVVGEQVGSWWSCQMYHQYKSPTQLFQCGQEKKMNTKKKKNTNTNTNSNISPLFISITTVSMYVVKREKWIQTQTTQ